MLSTETKRKIDNCRDTLVGKIPVPMSQIEQITLALTYKFMSDIDEENRELGGASFFEDEFEKFAWKNVMDKRHGGQERLSLYSEGLESMSRNKNVPELFRDIFRNAYLPFKDPSTLDRFLKQINEFHYEHSEELGNAFEYLLSTAGSQGDAGQFRTPRHIIEFLVSAVGPTKDDTILDPACGTAGFLISAYKYILEQNGINLPIEEKQKIAKNITGYDISHDMVRLSLVNMYLHNFADPKILEYDTLSSEDLWNEDFDCILANPPFMTPKGGIQPHKRFSIHATKSEVLFVDYIMEHLRTHGKAGIIVPEGVIFQSGKAYKELRENMVKNNFLWAVVSLPSGIFQPYSGVKTSILLFDRQLAKKTDKVLFIKVSADGFDLGAQRREIQKNDLPEALEILKSYKNTLEIAEFHKNLQPLLVEKSKIAGSGDFNLNGGRYRVSTILQNSAFEMVELSEICLINPKKSEVNNLPPDTEVSFVPMANISETEMYFTPQGTKELSEVSGSYTYFIDNDVLVAKVTPCFENGKSGIASGLTNGIGFGSSELIVLRASDKILPELLYYYISSDKFKTTGKMQMTGAGGLQRIPTGFVQSFQVPLPPLKIQEQIVAELDGYQKIIDGARQVVEHYKPTIKIDPNWGMVAFGEITESTKLGLTRNKGEQGQGGEKYIKMDAIDEKGQLALSKHVLISASKEEQKEYGLMNGDFLYNTRNAPNLVGKNAVYHGGDHEYIFNNNLLRIRFKVGVISDFVWCFLNQEEGISQIKSFINGTTSVAALYWKEFSTIRIPLPPHEIQEQIVARIKTEQRLVDATKELISHYEGKIKERIGEIWGEGISGE